MYESDIYHFINAVKRLFLNKYFNIMKKNMGKADRTIRFIVAAVVVALYATKVISGTLGLVLLVFAGVLLLTSLISFCPLYKALGISTCTVKKNA